MPSTRRRLRPRFRPGENRPGFSPLSCRCLDPYSTKWAHYSISDVETLRRVSRGKKNAVRCGISRGCNPCRARTKTTVNQCLDVEYQTSLSPGSRRAPNSCDSSWCGGQKYAQNDTVIAISARAIGVALCIKGATWPMALRIQDL